MTVPVTGKPDRGTEAPRRITGTRDSVSAILIVLAVGLAFRLILAYHPNLSGSGFEVDLNAFRFWAQNLAAEGTYGFYERPFFHDYTPGYLYVLWALGHLGTVLGNVADLIKLPAIAADVVLGWLVWSMARELGAGRRAAILGGAMMVANPITWFDSVVWGQVDSVGVVFLLLGLRELWRDRPERSAIFTMVAAVIKPQLGILVPLVAAITIRRALFPAGGFGRQDPAVAHELGGGRTLGWERRVDGPIRIVTTGLAGLLTAVVLSAGFGLSIFDLIGQVGTAAATYPYLTVNAYNPWALLSLDGIGVAANGQWVCDVIVPPGEDAPSCLQAFMFGPVPAVMVGTALLLLSLVATTLLVASRPDRRTVIVGLAVLAVAFFVVPTRVHERYLYPFFAIAAILAAVSVRWRIAYALISLATFANLYVVLTTLYAGNPKIEDWLGVGGAIRSTPGVTFVALAHLAGGLWVAAQLRGGAMRRLGSEIRQSRERDVATTNEDVGDAEQPAGGGLARPAGAGTGVGAGARATLAAGTRARHALPAWRDGPPLAGAGVIPWLRSRLSAAPVRPDRSATLRRERGGRLDRLDLWVVLVLVLAALTLRMWRLAEPYRMHFDEVYHARTAAEFLQGWRYGLSHEIYEWTHPHLAKYAMAAGLVAWGGDEVEDTAELGIPVADAVVEPRWEDPTRPGARLGDRLHVATGASIVTYDLRTRDLVATTSVPGAGRVALDEGSRTLYVSTATGDIVAVSLESVADGTSGTVSRLTTLEAPAIRLHVADAGATLVVATADAIVSLDAETGETISTADVPEVAALADAGTIPALVARPGEVTDPAAVASELAALLGGSEERYSAQLAEDRERVVIAPVDASGSPRTAIDQAVTEGRLEGVTVESLPRVAAATPDGVTFLNPADGAVVQTIRLDGGARGLALVEGIDDPKLYVTTGSGAAPGYRVMTVGGDAAKDEVAGGQTYPLPGPGSTVRWNSANQTVNILGEPPDDRPADQASTVYVIEPHGNAVYADAALGFEPAAVVLDADPDYPSSDRADVLALEADGTAATIDAGSEALAWRIPGVVAGVAMAALLYVLARILFARRSVAVLVAGLTLLDGMLFVQSRIGMNDAYVALFIVAAYTIFAAIWTGAWRWRGAFWVGMPAIGLLLGLALSSKWVAAYAIGALGILILARSALGRLMLVAGLVVVTTVLGYMAVSVPEGQSGNLTFMLIMIGLTLAAVLVAVLHPIAWSDDEVRFAVGAPAVAGIGIAMLALAAGQINRPIPLGPATVTPLHLGFALAMLSLGVAGAFWLAGRWGFGPLAPPPAPDDPARLLEPSAPPAEGWLRPGWLLGLPVAWTVVSLLAIPLAVYVASYIPWALIENHQLVAGWPPGNTGQTLLELTGQMYAYHNNLSSGHAASSPWWAWPLNLKPVWFYQQAYAGGTSGAVYDAGNLVLWWLGVPAMAFCAVQAFRRRSLPLALITIGFAAQWISWARIDRAAFQYHYYTSLPFVVLALAYFLAELWHGASRRTWLVARLAGALAVMGPALLWLFHRPLCGFVRVQDANEGSQACPTVIPDFVLTGRSLAVAVVVGVSVLLLVRQFLALDRPDRRSDRTSTLGEWGPLVATAFGAMVALLLVNVLFADVPILTLANVSVEPIALVVLVPLGAFAVVVASARDARRFVAGSVAAITAFFVIWYPNLSALPLPTHVVNTYQGFLPTYLYPFQFPVSTVDRTVEGPSLFGPEPAILLAALTVTCAILAYTAWVWRIALAERRRDEDLEPETGPGPALGTSGG